MFLGGRAARWHYCFPEVSMTAQRRTIHICTTLLLLVTMVIFVLVGTRRVTMHTPENVNVMHRVFAAISPVLDGYAAPVPIKGDQGEIALNPIVNHKLNHWIRSMNHEGPWMMMLPAHYTLNKSEPKRGIDLGHHGVPLGSHHPSRRLEESWIEEKEHEIHDALSKDSYWGNYQKLDFYEAMKYRSLMKCDNLVVYSIHPVNATQTEKEFLRHSFEWDQTLAASSMHQGGQGGGIGQIQCIMNLFPYDSVSRDADRYESVIRAMGLIASNSITRDNMEYTNPWIFSASSALTFTGHNQSMSDLLARLSLACTPEDQLPRKLTASPRQLSIGNGPADWLESLANMFVGKDHPGQMVTAKANSNIREDELPWHEEPGSDTVEALLCRNATDSMSCNHPNNTPMFHRVSYFVGTKPSCHYKYGPHLNQHAQLYRVSALSALIAGSMRDAVRQFEGRVNESLLLGRVLHHISGLAPADTTTICRARLDGHSGRRRWYDACRKYRRLIAGRTVDPRRFSGNGKEAPVYDESFDRNHVFIHDADTDGSNSNRVTKEIIRTQANLWLNPSAESAFRFFNGGVPSGDWKLEGPDSIGVVCGRWLAGSGCAADIESPGVIAESTAWTCNDFAVTFPSCSVNDFYKTPFRNQVVNQSCKSQLPWLRDNAGGEFTYKKFAEEANVESGKFMVSPEN